MVIIAGKNKERNVKTNDYELITESNSVPIKIWTHGLNTAKIPLIFSFLLIMPDVHLGN